MPEPLVTIAVPVYNGENYVEAALQSILAQTYKNFEVIVVDDGSNDVDFLRNIVANLNDPRFRLFQKVNGGVASALNVVLREMRGDFLAWLSHDDLFEADKLSTQVSALSECDVEYDVLFSNYSIINVKGQKVSEVDFTVLVQLCQRLGGIEQGLINGCTVLISKKILDDVGIFDETLKYTQDYDYWLRCLKAGKRFKFLPETLVSTRLHPDQDSNKNRNSAQKESEILWMQILDFWLSKSPNSLSLDLREMLEMREFLRKIGQSNAQQILNLSLVNKVSHILVSIVIPVANRIFQLEIALKSLQSQVHSNIEVIVVDDSPNYVFDIATLINNQPLNIQHIRNIVNCGAGQSRNIGISHSKGRYICFLDSDDFYLPDKISEQLVSMVAFSADVSHTNYFSRDELGHLHSFHDTSRHSGYNQHQFIAEYGCTMATPTVMINRKLIELNENPFPQNYSAGEDISAWIYLLHIASSSLLHINLPLTVVSLHANSAAKSVAAQKESQIAIQETLNNLGIKVDHVLRKKDFKFHYFIRRVLIKLLFFFQRIYLVLPTKVRRRLKNNTYLRKIFIRIAK
jgi:glycosyltransferase involved in cell wall biosynthesis